MSPIIQPGNNQRDGDFLLVALDNGVVKVALELGSGVFVLDGPTVRTDTWSRVTLSRDATRLTLRIDDTTALQGTCACARLKSHPIVVLLLCDLKKSLSFLVL